MRLHDTALGHPADLVPRQAGKVSMYVCGPTVYDHPHVGHGRFLLVFDVLRRYLEWGGMEVTYVSNVTDIDDKIINRANREGRTPEDVSVEFEKAWYDAVDRLGVKRPTHDPHATAYVSEMVAWVDGLVGAGVAYETSDGVYLSVAAVPDYGLLKSGQSLDDMRAGARVEVNEEKGSARDFALWKKVKPGEPSWPSPWGPGRPGWHTECVVMALDLLGEGFDIHGGGQDLAFPHHENERAQAVAAGKEFARRWAHNGFVVVGGEGGAVKMSKSLGNFTSLTDLLASHDPRAYRLLVLQSHYRAPVEVTPTSLEQASATLRGLDDFVRRAGDASVGAAPDEAAVAAFRAAMDDDLSTPAVVALLSDLRRRANVHLDAGEPAAAGPLAAAVQEISGAVGLRLGPGVEEAIPADVADLVTRRDQARADRDFAAADALRDELVAMGWVVEDTASGTKVHQ
ncbi:MAG: cysteinyl-tRNA synthetase [Actinomycetota bacterium]|nr:cysteinyl-tRNA synthetase [Actinomycetota bacterium]